MEVTFHGQVYHRRATGKGTPGWEMHLMIIKDNAQFIICLIPEVYSEIFLILRCFFFANTGTFRSPFIVRVMYPISFLNLT